MKIIMLSGESHSGKTKTLNKVYDYLILQGATIINPKVQLGGQIDDFESIIKYKGKTIAFFTMGDYSTAVTNAFDKFNRLNCDFLICACNNHFILPYRKIKQFENQIIDKEVAKSKKQADCDIANNVDKDKIINCLAL